MVLCLLLAVVLCMGMIPTVFPVSAASGKDQTEDASGVEASDQEDGSAEKVRVPSQGTESAGPSESALPGTAASAAEKTEEDPGADSSRAKVSTDEKMKEDTVTDSSTAQAPTDKIKENETSGEEMSKGTEEDTISENAIVCNIPHVMARAPEVPTGPQAPEHHKHLNYANNTSVSIPDDTGARAGDSGGAHHDTEGWYDLSLDVTGGETTWSDTPQADIIFIVDNSNSMKLAPYMDPNAKDKNGDPLFTQINSQREDPNEQSDGTQVIPEHYVLKDGVLWPAYAYGDTDIRGNTRKYWCLVSDASETYEWNERTGRFEDKYGNKSALYSYNGPTRMQAAQESLKGQLDKIRDSGIESQISVVSFGNRAQVLVENNESIDEAETAIANLQPNGGGTNWDDALQKAKGIETRDGVPTYVVFISDGNPTFYGSGPSGNGQESDTNNVEASWRAASATANRFLEGKEGWSFYSVAAFNTQIFHMSDGENGIAWHVYEGKVPNGHVYTASQADDFTTALGNIITDIKEQTKKTTGHYSKASIADTLSSLVDAKEGSIYYTVSKIVNGKKETKTFTPGNGSVTFSDGTEVNVPASEAVLTGKNLTWNLGSDFELNPGATFAVHLKVRPNQEAHDLSAADKNGSTIENADVVLKDSLGKLERNSVDDMMIYANSGTPTVSYKDPEGKEGSSNYTEKPELPVPYSKISIEKVWKTAKPDSVTSVTVDLLQDGKEYKKFTLMEGNQWKAEALVPAGPTGHTYQIKEKTDLGDGWTVSYSYSGYDKNGEATNENKNGEVKNKEIDQVTFDSPCSLEQREGAFTIKNAKLDTSGRVEVKKIWKDTSGKEITDTNGLWATFELWRTKTQKPGQEKKQYTVTVKTKYFLGLWNSTYGSTDDSDGDLADGPSKTFTVETGDTLPFTITVTGEDGRMGIYSSSIGSTALVGDMSDPTGGIFTINGTYGQSLYRHGSYQLENITGDTTVEITLLGMVKVNGIGWRTSPSIEDSVSIAFGTPVSAPDPDPVPAGEEKVPGIDPVTLKDGTWSYIWDKLPVKDADGNPYSYFVKETGCSPGFKLEAIDNNGGITNGTITAANKQTTTSISVKKVWDDNGNRRGIRPDSVTVSLYQNGVKTDQTRTLSEDSGWTAKFADLPTAALVTGDGSKSWQQISYSVKEENVPEGYMTSTEQERDGSWTVTNKLVYKLPDTAGPGNYLLLMCGTALITAALLLVIDERRKGDS